MKPFKELLESYGMLVGGKAATIEKVTVADGALLRLAKRNQL